MSRLYDEALADSGMTTPQFAVLRNIDRAGELPLSRLADRLVMERTTLYRTLAPLDRAGWLEIAADARGRAKIVRLTDAGRAAMAQARHRWAQVQNDVVGEIGTAQWAALADSLEGLIGTATVKLGEQP